MISEAPPENPADDFYAPGNPFYMQTTLHAFNEAGFNFTSIQDILGIGIYITTAVKCGKTGYTISTATIQNCSALLEVELQLFSNIQAIIINGDVAIRSFNYITRRQSGKRVIPAGSTYKIRTESCYYHDIRVFPSYILTGQNFLIEKSKRRMISEDIQNAMKLLKL
ncbi:uracil-DNA glycosylase [candidate division KSB1 bacterium]|nr:uracil-DNA glycosylase [candidate division KSB1 bacterium]